MRGDSLPHYGPSSGDIQWLRAHFCPNYARWAVGTGDVTTAPSLTAHDTNVDSQCPIPAGGSFTYTFTLGQYGTYWYHSHTAVEYTDGLLGVNL